MAGAGQLQSSGATIESECGRSNGIDSQHAYIAGAGEDSPPELLAAPPLDADGFKHVPRLTGPDVITGILLKSPTPDFSSAVSVAAASDALFLPRSPSPSSTAKRRRKRGPQRPGMTAKHMERLFVQHDYHDLSSELDISDYGESTNITLSNHPPPPSTTILSQSFPLKLHRILEESEAAGLGHIISWQPHGRAFKIRSLPLFAEQIMREYFPKMKRVTSFQRQFNLYGFEKLSRDGPDNGAYYHEAFLRHCPGLCLRRMTRKRVKGTGYKAASNPEVEPDLYAFPPMGEIFKKKVAGSISGTSLQTSTHTFFRVDEATSNQDATKKVAISPAYLESTSLHRERDDSPNQHSLPPPHMQSSFMPPRYQQYLPHMADSDAGTNHEIECRNTLNVAMDEFFSLSKVDQDLSLEEFVANIDITPLSLLAGTSVGQQQKRQQQQHQAHDPILVEFADLWQSGSFYP